MRFLKRLNYGKTRHVLVYQRSQNIPRSTARRRGVWVVRGLYPVYYTRRALITPQKFKYGMFSFTRKPFAIPEKKGRKKR